MRNKNVFLIFDFFNIPYIALFPYFIELLMFWVPSVQWELFPEIAPDWDFLVPDRQPEGLRDPLGHFLNRRKSTQGFRDVRKSAFRRYSKD